MKGVARSLARATPVVFALTLAAQPGCVSQIPKGEARAQLLAIPRNARFSALQCAVVVYSAPDGDGALVTHTVHANYVRAGSSVAGRPTVLLLHGTPSSLFTWGDVIFGTAQTPGLATDFDVIAVDLPGHGLSDASPPNSWDAMVAFVRSFLRTVGVERAAVVGNSYGGEIAWRLAAEPSSPVQSLVLICSSGYQRKDSEITTIDSLLSGWMGHFFVGFSTRERVKGGLSEVFANAERISEDLVTEKFLVLHAQGNRDTAVDFYQAESGDAAPRIKSIRVPTLLLWGRGDKKYTIETQGEQFHRDIPGSVLVPMDDCGHTPQYECPDKTTDEIRRFLLAPR